MRTCEIGTLYTAKCCENVGCHSHHRGPLHAVEMGFKGSSGTPRSQLDAHEWGAPACSSCSDVQPSLGSMLTQHKAWCPEQRFGRRKT